MESLVSLIDPEIDEEVGTSMFSVGQDLYEPILELLETLHC